MRTTSIVVALALLPAALAAQARPAVTQQPIHLTMQEGVRGALAAGEEGRGAEAAHQHAHGQVTQAYSAALPELRASLTYTRTFASVFTSGQQTGPPLPPFEPDTTAPLGDP